MGDSIKSGRGASYPVVDLEKAVALTQKMLSAVGKASTTKLNLAKALGYSGINGKSNRITAALGQYGFVSGRGEEYKLTELALKLLFPQTDSERDEALVSAAKHPVLFQQLIEKFKGEPIPALLPNILVSGHGINPSSSVDATNIFRSTLQYAGLLDKDDIIATDDSGADNHNRGAESVESMPPIGKDSAVAQVQNQPLMPTEGSLNRIEIVLREGVKAGIYAPHDLSLEEKQKLKTIIDLL